ncbi:MAG: hypothetical protein QOD57_5400, partial [Actinomycetota bacterium]|nr:hypothetical protein [Actinomycetota bacterium]
MPTQPTTRARPRHPWMLAALAALLAAGTLAPAATAGSRRKPGGSGAAGGPVVPPKQGTTWVGTYQEASGPQLVKQNRVLDLEQSIGRTEDVDHIYEGWGAQFPGWREDWDHANGRVPFVS